MPVRAVRKRSLPAGRRRYEWCRRRGSKPREPAFAVGQAEDRLLTFAHDDDIDRELAERCARRCRAVRPDRDEDRIDIA